MKKLLLIALLLLIAVPCFAATTEEYHTFFNKFTPATGPDVQYYQTGVTDVTKQNSTGDYVVTNTYIEKSLQIATVSIAEPLQISIEGRLQPMDATPNWAILYTKEIGVASADTAKNYLVSVPDYVDFLRVGMRTYGSTSTNAVVTIKGAFTNLER